MMTEREYKLKILGYEQVIIELKRTLLSLKEQIDETIEFINECSEYEWEKE